MLIAAKDPLLDNWPITLFVPAALILIGVLALVTRLMDRRDERAREAMVRDAAGRHGTPPPPHGRP
jgi:hypothetical protein